AEEARKQHQTIRLLDLKNKFQLSSFDFDAFLLCIAPALDTRYERVYGYLQDDVTHKYPGIGLILDVLLPSGLKRLQYLDHFLEHAPLLRYGLLKKLNTSQQNGHSALRLFHLASPEIVSWLMGQYRPAEHLSDHIVLTQPGDSLEITGDPIEFDLNWETLAEQKPALVLYGIDEQQQQLAARTLSARLGQDLLSVNLRSMKSAGLLDQSVLRFVFRDAALTNAIPHLIGWECFFNEEGIVPDPVFIELNNFEGVAIISSESVWQIVRKEMAAIKPILWWKFDLPTSTQRLHLWEKFLGDSVELPTNDLDILAGQFALTSNQIQNAVHSAKDVAFQNSRAVSSSDLFEAARQHSSHHLDNLAIKIEPRYVWKDIILPEDQMATLREIANTVRWRSVVLENWGVGERLAASSGVSALFGGPPGTGKTLAAQVIAAELKMDLYKIDLSTVVSKYIGETEKNLERIFSQAKNSNAILFFDEADAIFGKRSEVKDAHDRYANIEVGYLLQRMETYDGVVILATNMRSNLDDAFTRRLQFVVDFPFPDEEHRLKIWQVLFPEGVPREGEIDFKYFADRFDLAGGSIRNIIVGAAFLAASEEKAVAPRHLMHAMRREMQKMGRLINEKDLALET
ncbi:MAG: AAA family ATPase, partial [Anaerolineaceae bacterium]|nr:AAA family ATPase [Anaerolineaceae bacterium]